MVTQKVISAGDLTVAESEKPSDSRKMTLFFAIAYLSQGISCAQFGIVAQPIQCYMMKGLTLSAADISSCMAIMMIPWVIKPFYGLLCDFIPLFGYRRKSYLILANALAAAAFAIMAQTGSLTFILLCLFFTAVSMALATCLMVGLAVEASRASGKARRYFCAQEVGYYSASMVAAVAGGMLCNVLKPVEAVHYAALIGVGPLVLMAILTAGMLREQKSVLNTEELKQTAGALFKALRCAPLQAAFILSWCWNFLPATGVPLYFFESNSIGFTQAEIGQLGAWYAGAMLLSAIVYPKLTRNLSLRQLIIFTAALSCASVLAYLGLSNYATGVLLECLRGCATMFNILSLYLLAAKSCPARTEVTVMAILVALRNLATDASTFTGGQLFTHVFHNQYQPLVIVAFLAPAASLLVLPMIGEKGNTPPSPDVHRSGSEQESPC